MPTLSKDVYAGLLILALSTVIGIESIRLPLGDPMRMGPGLFPISLAVIAGLLGFTITVAGLRKSEPFAFGMRWSSICLIVVAMGMFSFGIVDLGLVPTVFITALVAGFAGHDIRLWVIIAVAAVLALLCWLVFGIGLNLPVRTFGPWFGVA